MTTSRIEMNVKVMLGKPVIRGTRIPVELILRKLSEGATEADLLDAYPRRRDCPRPEGQRRAGLISLLCFSCLASDRHRLVQN